MPFGIDCVTIPILVMCNELWCCFNILFKSWLIICVDCKMCDLLLGKDIVRQLKVWF